MDKDWIEAIKNIRVAQENNQLVIFVGSGVSKNSGVPSWRELVKTIADNIHYDKCEACCEKNDDCPKSTCQIRYDYTQEELVRIPEYFFQKDTPNNYENYYNLIENTLRVGSGPNPIDDEIFDIMPHHIITTNFDSLLEDSTALNSKLYTVVAKDNDLISRATDKYIIKMHGDFEDKTSLVLKESDYIDYEQNHPLISTFIKALLVNHTFLFLGYSLNDYNLNLIIGWINYFSKKADMPERPKNFLISSDSPSEYESLRLKDKNIFVVDLSSLPQELLAEDSCQTSITDAIGHKLYSFLKCITDTTVFDHYIPLSETLNSKYHLLHSYKHISLDDLIQVHSFGKTDFIGTLLEIYDNNIYNNFIALLESDDAPTVKNVFHKTILTEIVSFKGDSFVLSYEEGIDDECFQLYLDNNYRELEAKLESCDDNTMKIYYYLFMEKSKDILDCILSLDASDASNCGDFIAILLHKIRALYVNMYFSCFQRQSTKEISHLFNTAPSEYKSAITYLKKLFYSSSEDKYKMIQSLEKQEIKYAYKSNTTYHNHDYHFIWKIQSLAYDYYFFFKENGLPIDHFTNAKDYLQYYLKAILCSYSPTADPERNGNIFFSRHKLQPYPINEVDFDMFIKYIRPKDFQAFLKKYHVSELTTTGSFDVCQKYVNLCASFSNYLIWDWCDYIFNFNIIICLLNLENDQRKNLFSVFVTMLIQLKENPLAISHLFESVYYLIVHLSVDNIEASKSEMLKLLIDKDIFSALSKRHSSQISSVIDKLSSCVTEEIKNEIVGLIETIPDQKDKLDKVFIFRHLIPMDGYKSLIEQNVQLMNPEQVFWLLYDRLIEYNADIYKIFVETIKTEVNKREQNPSIQTFPDHLQEALADCLLLKLIGCDVDLSALEPYKKYSDPLTFMLDPDNFDYSLVDTGNYMWQNLIYSKYYQDYFINHKEELLTEDLKNIFDCNNSTTDQQKIVYGLLLDKEDLSKF